MTTGAASGYVLTSDATGNASWQVVASSGWGLSGNAGTNPLTQFIGTTDNQDLVFKTNNIEKFRIFADLNASGQIMNIGTGDILIDGITL